MSEINYFKSSKLNLWPLNEKAPAHRVGGSLITLGKWREQTDFSGLSKQIKKGDNIGFLAGLQFATNKYIEALDFDIYDDATKANKEITLAMYNKFASLDTNNKRGFFSGSTCGNYGVLIDTTNNPQLRAKIEECKKVNQCKIDVDSLEIHYHSNVALPPSATRCKKCHKTHMARKMLADEMGFCVPNAEQSTMIIEIIDKFLSGGKCKKTKNDNNKPASILAKAAACDVSRIHKNKMLVILECLKESRFTCKQSNGWGQLVVQVANANNCEEVINAFWNRCRVGAYANITYNEIANAINSVKISEDFNCANLWKIAKEDNEELYNKYFNKYDEPEFAYQPIIFTDGTEKSTHFINFEEASRYFEGTQYRFIKSSLGTGKTQFIKKVVECHFAGETEQARAYGGGRRPWRVLFITMRQSLARSLSTDFENFGNYLNKEHQKRLTTFDKVIISLDSLEKLGTFNEEAEYKGVEEFDLVICDEICSLLKHFDFKEIKNVEMCYRIFKYYIQSSKQTYFLDGDISNREIGWFNKYIKRGGDNVQKPLFNALTGIKYDLKLSYCKAGQYNKILEALEAGKNIAIVCMSSAECLKMYNALGDKYKTKVIHGNSSDAEKAELCNINSIITNYQCFIYSPSISVGVDINPKIEGIIYKHFDNIFGYVCEGSVCPRDYFQMLARVRNPKSLTINILIANFDMKLTGLYDIIPFEKYYRIMFGDEPVNGLSYIKSWNKWETDNSKYWLDVFKWYGLQKGHTFEIIQTSKDEYSTEAKKLEETKIRLNINIMKSDKAEMIFDSIVLNQNSRFAKNDIFEFYHKEDKVIYEQIRSKRIITEEDKELLMIIDERNDFDNMEHKQKAIEAGYAITFDKLNMEKSVYWYYFGLPFNLTLEDFKENYYRKIETVRNYIEITKPRENCEKKRAEFDNSIISKKIVYLKQIMGHIGAEGYGAQVITKEINYDAINTILQSENFKITYSIMEKSRGSKKITKKNERTEIIEKAYTRTQILGRVKDILAEFGFEYVYTRVRVGNERVNAYELSPCKAIKQYNERESAGTAEEIEYDF